MADFEFTKRVHVEPHVDNCGYLPTKYFVHLQVGDLVNRFRGDGENATLVMWESEYKAFIEYLQSCIKEPNKPWYPPNENGG